MLMEKFYGLFVLISTLDYKVTTIASICTVKHFTIPNVGN